MELLFMRVKRNTNRGGTRHGSGRPPTIKGKRREIYLPDEFWNVLLEIGEGNASAGIRKTILERREGALIRRSGFPKTSQK